MLHDVSFLLILFCGESGVYIQRKKTLTAYKQCNKSLAVSLRSGQKTVEIDDIVNAFVRLLLPFISKYNSHSLAVCQPKNLILYKCYIFQKSKTPWGDQGVLQVCIVCIQ